MTTRETDRTTWTAEPEPETQPESDPVPYMAPQSDPTPIAEIEADGETDTEVAPELDDDVETRPEANDESEPHARTDDETEADDEPEIETEPERETEAYHEPEAEAETDDEPELDDDGQSQPDLDLHEESDTDLVPGMTAPPGKSETLGLPDVADLPETPATTATGGRPFLTDAGVYEERWTTIKTSFVDAPREAVQSADRLVAEAMEDRARILASHRDSLQAQWCQDDDIDTERLRVVFQDYRAFLVGPLSS